MRRFQAEYTPSMGSRAPYQARIRANWGLKGEFFAVLISCFLTTDIINRFPYLCYKNGGVVFLVPFAIFMLLLYLPLVVLEAAIGQFAGVSWITMWRACPLFKGVGVALLVLGMLLSTLGGVNITWALYYLYLTAVRNPLPWTRCDNHWNTQNCVNNNQTSSMSSQTPSEEYFNYMVLKMSDGIEDLFSVNYPLLISLGVAWFLVMLALCAGIKSLGKLAYIMATLPFFLLFVLLGRGLTLPGSIDGVKFVVFPNVKKFLEPSLWINGAQYAFHLFGYGMFYITPMASYNRFPYNSYRDVLLLPLVLWFANILGAVVVFSFIGFLSQTTQLPISTYVKSDYALTYFTMTLAMGTLPIPHLWTVIYLVTEFTIRFGSLIVLVQCLVSAITDEIEVLGRRWWSRFLTLLLVCSVLFTLSVPCVTQGGIYVFHLLGETVTRLAPYVCLFLTCIGFAGIYGMRRLYEDMALMYGRKPCILWKAFWCFFIPIFTLSLLGFSLMDYASLNNIYFGEYVYPLWAVVVGWLVAVLPVLIIILGMIFQVARFSGKNLRDVVKPTEKWGPVEGVERSHYQTPSAPTTGTLEMKPPPYVENPKAWAY